MFHIFNEMRVKDLKYIIMLNGDVDYIYKKNGYQKSTMSNIHINLYI